MLCVGCLASAGEEILLWRKGETPAPVVMVGGSPQEQKTVKSAVISELQKMTGVDFPVLIAEQGTEMPSPALVLKIAEPSLADAPPDQFRIHSDGGRVYISASASTGVLYGFYEFMERLGSKFWSYNEEDIPRLETLRVPPLDFTWKPPFRMHDIMSWEAQTPENHFREKSRALSPLQFTPSQHSLYPLLTPYAKTHPEIYPLIQEKDKATGKILKEGRKPNDLHFCYSADGIAEALAVELAKEVEKNGGNVRDKIYFAGMGDWSGGMCQCPQCLAIYEEETWVNADGHKMPGYTGTLLRMINKTAEILEKKYPGIQVGTFAYKSLEAPPGKTRPRDNVVIQVPRNRHCGVHPAETCPENREYWLNLSRWCQLAPGRVAVWEYGVCYTNFMYPFPVLESMAANIAAYHKLGVAGLMIQGNYVTTGGHMVVMNNYIWSRLLRDPSLEVEPLIEAFLQGYYGPAAPAIREYIAALAASTNEPVPLHADEFVEPVKSYLTKTTKAKLRDILAKARASVAADPQSPFFRRVEELWACLEALDLWPKGPLGERDGKLVRLDIKGDTFSRVRTMKQYSRGTTPREFGAARIYWEILFQEHGGPIARLEKDALSLSVLPSRKASFGPVTLNHAAVIASSWLTSIFYGELAQEPDDSIVMIADSGIEEWHHETKHVIRQTLRITDPQTVSWESEILRKTINPKYGSLPIGVRTLYPVQASTQGIELAWCDRQGKWHTSPMPTQPGQPMEVGELTAWRVKMPRSVVTDTYMEPGHELSLTGSVGIDKESRRLYTEVAALPGVNLPLEEFTPWLRRTIQIVPATTSP